MQSKSYKEILLDELKRRHQKNSKYSLRTLASDLEISSGFLSQIISGKRYPSEEKAYEISRLLGISQENQQQFINSIRCEKVHNPKVRRAIRLEMRHVLSDNSFRQIEKPQISVFSHWFCPAILEILTMPNADTTCDGVARRLGLSHIETSVALERLVQVGLVTERGGVFSKIHGNITTPFISSLALRRHHESVLMKAKESLQQLPFEERDASSVTMCIDPKKIPEARQRIQNFRRELMEFLEEGNRSHLYMMHINLFRADKEI